MDVYTASELVNGMKFRPGWKFSARIWDRAEIMVTAELDTYDTRYRTASGQLTTKMEIPAPAIFINVTQLDKAGLAYRIIRDIVRPIDDHEDREFLVFQEPDGSWKSPVHPHERAGEDAWKWQEIHRQLN